MSTTLRIGYLICAAVSLVCFALLCKCNLNYFRHKKEDSSSEQEKPSRIDVELEKWLAQANMSHVEVPKFKQTIYVFMAFGLVLGWLIGQDLLIALVVSAICVLLPFINIKFKARKIETVFTDQLADALLVIANSLKSGLSVQAAFSNYASHAKAPIKNEFNHIVNDLILGRSLSDAVLQMADRMGNADAKYLGQTIKIQEKTGAPLAAQLQNIAFAIKERQQLKADAEALLAGPRGDSKMLVAVPVLSSAYLIYSNPEYQEFYRSRTGIFVLLGIGALMLLSYIILQKIINMDIDDTKNA